MEICIKLFVVLLRLLYYKFKVMFGIYGPQQGSIKVKDCFQVSPHQIPFSQCWLNVGRVYWVNLMTLLTFLTENMV